MTFLQTSGVLPLSRLLRWIQSASFKGSKERICSEQQAFWRVFNNLPSCEKLHDRDSYHVMRDERRRPVW